MTVVAWDGTTLAADKRAVSNGGIARTVTKIQRHMGSLLAMTGDWDVAAEMREWYKAGAVVEKFPAEARGSVASLIVITIGKEVLSFTGGPYPMMYEQEKVAFGSGRDFAEAAMYLGYDAGAAVRTACALQSDCGNGVDLLEWAE